MKRAIFSLLALMTATGGAVAADCTTGLDGTLVLQDWEVTGPSVADSNLSGISFFIQNRALKDITELDASVRFVSVKTGYIGTFLLPADELIAADADIKLTTEIETASAERLEAASKADIAATICTYTVGYADGTSETF